MNQYTELQTFGPDIVKLLTDEAIRVAAEPDFEGLELAALLMLDALKYRSIYQDHARVGECYFLTAAQKLREWNIANYCNRQSA